MTDTTAGTATQGTTGASPTPNTPTFKSVLDAATQLGAEAGRGKDTQVKFDMKVLEGAYHGVVDLSPNKHGQGKSDMVVLAEAYVKASQGAVIFDSKAPNQRRLISNVGKCIKLGSTSKWGVGEPLQNVNDLMTRRQKLRATGKIKQLDDAHNTLMRYATAQLKSDTLISGDALEAFCFKRQTEERDAIDVFKAIQKTAMNLKVGKVANCNDTDNSKELQDIIAACNKRVAALVKQRSGNT